MMKLLVMCVRGCNLSRIPFVPLSNGCRECMHGRLSRFTLRNVHSESIASSTNSPVRVRFAPSPTGQLHLGGLRTALYNFLFARAHNGTFVLRIEDTDQTRLVPNAVESLIQMLDWTGITIDEGPHCGGSFGPYIQSERLPLYTEQIKILLENGSAYPCFCTPHRLDLLRREAAARREVPRYDNRCRHINQSDVRDKMKSGTPYVVRLKLEPFTEPWEDLVFGPVSQDVASVEGDPILMKSDGFPTYHFANVVDDHFMQITHVLRGVEWLVSTTKHLLLYRAFGWQPPAVGHFPLLTNKDGKKFSKRQNDIHVEHYKNLGYFPEAVLNLVTNVGSGFTVRDTAGMEMSQLVAHFDVRKVTTHSSRVDFDRLTEFNQLHMQRYVDDERQLVQLVGRVRQLIQQRVEQADDLSDERIRNLLILNKTRISMLSDLCQDEYEFAWRRPVPQYTVRDLKDVSAILEQTLEAVTSIDSHRWNQDTLTAAIGVVIQAGGWTYGRCMKVLRQAVSGPKPGPTVLEVMEILGQSATVDRLQRALASVGQHRQTASQTDRRSH